MERLKAFLSQLRIRGDLLYNTLNHKSGGTLGILATAIRQFSNVRAAQAAATIAYYAFFSLFPLLAVLVSGVSYLVGEDQVQSTLIEFIIGVFPGSRGLIRENVSRLMNFRGTYGLVGLVALFWSATNVFASIAFHINLAWARAKARNFIQKRLVAFSLFAGFIGLLVVSLFLTNLIQLLSTLGISEFIDLGYIETIVWETIVLVFPPAVTFLIFYLMYRWVPSTNVNVSEALFGSLFATVLWQITAVIFDWYIGSGFLRFDIIYGSLATITVFMLWFYINSMIVLFGAHLSAAIATHRTPPPEFVDDEEPVISRIEIDQTGD